MYAVLTDLGLYPAHPFSLYYPLAVLGLWLLFLPLAYLRGIRIFYTASLKAALGEELLFRGIIYGAILIFTHSAIEALLISSLLFGIFHMRNLWWAGWKRSWSMSVYAGFTAGPIFGIIRLLSGDIYLGILVHFVHNFLIMFPLPGLKRYVATVPKDMEIMAGK